MPNYSLVLVIIIRLFTSDKHMTICCAASCCNFC